MFLNESMRSKAGIAFLLLNDDYNETPLLFSQIRRKRQYRSVKLVTSLSTWMLASMCDWTSTRVTGMMMETRLML